MSAVLASTEGRKPLTTAQLYSAAHPKINGALHHKGLARDITQCHCLVIGTVRHGDTQMAQTLKTLSADQSAEYDPSEARFEMACAGDWLRQAEYCPDQSAETDDDDWRF